MKVVFLLQGEGEDFPKVECNAVLTEVCPEDKYNVATITVNNQLLMTAGIRHGKDWFFSMTPCSEVTVEQSIFAHQHCKEFPTQICAKIKEEMDKEGLDFNHIASVLNNLKRISNFTAKVLAHIIRPEL